jgi:dTDP-4-dehydrorhamnose reductase
MWLLVGGDSEIGEATRSWMLAKGHSVAATTRRPERASVHRPLLDLARPLEGFEPPKGTEAACILAGIPRLADCAADPQGSAFINVTQTLALISLLIERGIAVLFLSTNQVFDGTMPNMPADSPLAPISEYGRQKSRVETALRAQMQEGAPIAILRLSKVVSPTMSLVQTWVSDLACGEPIHAFDDMTLAPVPVDLVARAIAALMQDRARGIFQLTGPRDITYAGAAHYLAKRLEADPELVKAVSARAAGLPDGSTPLHTTLDSSALQERCGLYAPDAYQVIEALLTSRAASA